AASCPRRRPRRPRRRRRRHGMDRGTAFTPGQSRGADGTIQRPEPCRRGTAEEVTLLPCVRTRILTNSATGLPVAPLIVAEFVRIPGFCNNGNARPLLFLVDRPSASVTMQRGVT